MEKVDLAWNAANDLLRYVPCHCHTDHSSPFDGLQTVEEYVARLKEIGAPAAALTDHGTMSGCLDFYFACKEAGIKPILGIEAYFVPDPKAKMTKGMRNYHLILLAMNNDGYENLKELDEEAYRQENVSRKPRVGWESLKRHSEGVICATACMASIVNTEDGESWFCKFHDLFGDRFYAEVQPNEMDEQKEYNRKVLVLAEKYGVPVIVTTDAHFSRKEDAPYHKLWTAVQHVSYHDDENYVMTGEEILAHGMKREWLDETLTLAERCNVSLEMEGTHYPVYPTEDREAKIREICESNWDELVPKGKEDEYRKRYESELAILKKVDYLNYLLIIWDMLRFCEENKIATGVGRGSVGGSLVCYLMKIHRIDPIKYGTKFFRFVNEQRVTPCDIDTDVSTPKREQIIDYIRQKYGHVSKIFTENRLSDKSALKRAGQALGIPPQQIQSLSDQMGEKTLDVIPDIRYTSLDHETLVKLADTAKHFIGRLEKMGVHASAILVAPDKITKFCPLEGAWSTDKENGGKSWTRAAAYSWHDLEGKFGMLKLDILGLGTLEPVYQTLEKEGLSIGDIPMDDAKTYETYASGNLVGVFQMESPGMRRIAQDLHVKEFSDVRALVALYRPGPIDSGMLQQYVAGANGAEVSYPCPQLEKLTKETYGVLVYQETIMLVAIVMAGYSLGEADKLRKTIGRKEMDKIHAATEEFVSRCMQKGFSEEIARNVAKQVEAAGRYVFNLSHATEYGYLSYITAYLKTHYPADYLCALINSKDSHDEIVPLVDELKRMGIAILPPDLRKGNRDWQVEKGGVRVGLTYVKGVGRKLVIPESLDWDSIVEANTKTIVAGLAKSGALDFLGKSRAWMLPNLEFVKKHPKKKHDDNQISLFGDLLPEPENPGIEPLTDYVPSVGEYEVLTFTFHEKMSEMPVTVTGIKEKLDKNGNNMAFVEMSTPYGKQRGVVFASHWKKDIHLRQGAEYTVKVEKGVIKTSKRISKKLATA